MSNIVSKQTQQQPADMASQIVAMASNPDFDVEKLKALIDLQNSELKRQAEVAFSGAFAQLQAEIPTIIEDKKGNGSTYATLETIVDVTRPLLNRHGFSVTFDTKTHLAETPTKNSKNEFVFFGYVKVTAVLRHKQGFYISTESVVPFDFSGSKSSNTAQAQGSATSYGKRYAYCSLLNITTRNGDDDAEMLNNSYQVKITTLQAKQLQALYDDLPNKAGFDGWLLGQFSSSDLADIPKGAYQMVLGQLQASRGITHENA